MKWLVGDGVNSTDTLCVVDCGVFTPGVDRYPRQQHFGRRAAGKCTRPKNSGSLNAGASIPWPGRVAAGPFPSRLRRQRRRRAAVVGQGLPAEERREGGNHPAEEPASERPVVCRSEVLARHGLVRVGRRRRCRNRTAAGSGVEAPRRGRCAVVGQGHAQAQRLQKADRPIRRTRPSRPPGGSRVANVGGAGFRGASRTRQGARSHCQGAGQLARVRAGIAGARAHQGGGRRQRRCAGGARSIAGQGAGQRRSLATKGRSPGPGQRRPRPCDRGLQEGAGHTAGPGARTCLADLALLRAAGCKGRRAAVRSLQEGAAERPVDALLRSATGVRAWRLQAGARDAARTAARRARQRRRAAHCGRSRIQARLLGHGRDAPEPGRADAAAIRRSAPLAGARAVAIKPARQSLRDLEAGARQAGRRC